jgi:hypothetical protein
MRALRLGGEFGVSLSGGRVERGLRVPRQQGFQLLGRLGLRKFLKQMAQVGVGLDAVGAAGHDDGIHGWRWLWRRVGCLQKAMLVSRRQKA